MADNSTNPFSSYSLDEQNQYADQLRGAMASGKLNPAQTQGVQSALKYLPMSKAAADQNLSNLATHGQGTWQPTLTPKYNPSPEGARQAIIAQYMNQPQAGPEFEGSSGEMLLHGLGEMHKPIGDLGASTAETLLRTQQRGDQIDPRAVGVARGVGRFAGEFAGDPTNLALASMGTAGKLGQAAMGLGFGVQMGKGAYEQAGDVGSRWDTMTPSEKAEGVTSLGLTTAMAGMSSAHGVSSLRTPAPKPSYRAPEPTPVEPLKTEPLDEELRRGGPGSPPPTTPDTTQTFIRPSRMGTPQGISDMLSSAKSGQSSETTARVEQHKMEKKAIGEEVQAPVPSTPQPPPKDNSTFSQAKEEWLKSNPGADVTNASAMSWIARRAQELKTGVADKTIQPLASPQPDTGSKWKSIQQQIEAGETPKGAGSPPLQRPPAQPIDLSGMSHDERHEWFNKNAPVTLTGSTLEEARATAKTIFGDEADNLKITPYLDKDSKLRYGSLYPVAENKTSLPSQSETASAKKPPASAQASGAPAYVGNPETQALEQKLLKAGAGQQMLDTLQKAAKDSAPDGTPPESIQKVYHRSLDALSRGLETGDSKLMRKAFDIANRRLEAGRFTPAGRPAMSPAQSKVFEEFHVTKMLDKWESFTDEQLKSRDVRKKLTSDEFSNSVAATSNPALEMRHNALLERVGHLGADPIAALGRLFGGQHLSAGDISRGVLRESLATAARSKDMNAHALDTYIQQWNSRPVHETVSFIDSIETGNIGSIPDPQDRMVAQRLRDMLDAKRDQINSLGTGKFDTFIENYFPHLWKFGVTDIARQTLQGRRPLAGGAGFLKPRTYTSFAEGIANGLEPVTYNPVQMALLKLHEMDRYLAAHTAFEELKTRGLAAPFIPKDVPDGWVKLNDQMFRAGEQSYYAPADAARPINNHLSPGLRGNALFNSVTAYNNLLNQFNLGFSVFHGTETAINSIASEMGLGLQKLSRGDIKGVANIGKSVVAPAQLLRTYLLGTHVMREYLEPGRYAQLSSVVDALQSSGGRIAMPPEFKNAAVEAWANAFKEYNSAKGFQNIPAFGKMQVKKLGAIMEALSSPLMEKFVPRIKLGTFAREAQDILDRLPPNTPKEVMRAELGKAWDSIDNRFGQVVYDNLFWNRTAKDIAHIAIRSVGWNLGTLREIGGGVLNVRDLQQPLSGKGFTTKQAYILALGTMTLGMGAVINAAYNQKPQSLTDYIYPKTGKIGPDGEPERIMLKTYIHDSLAFGHSPGQTAVNKLSPAWNQLANLYSNSDYYGTRIHPIHSSTSAALSDSQTYTSTASYLGKSALPFSLENYNQRRLSGESILSSLSSSAAILPAPKWAGQTPAASMAYEFYKTKLSRGPNDPDVTARLQRYHQLASGYAANQFSVADITKAYKNKEITTKQFDGILDESDGKLTPLQRHSKQLSPVELLQVWHLASPEERQSLQEMFLHKWDTITDDPDLSNKFNSAWKASRQR